MEMDVVEMYFVFVYFQWYCVGMILYGQWLGDGGDVILYCFDIFEDVVDGLYDLVGYVVDVDYQFCCQCDCVYGDVFVVLEL